MKATDVRALSADQRQEELLKLKKEQFNLRFQVATGQLRSRIHNAKTNFTRRRCQRQNR